MLRRMCQFFPRGCRTALRIGVFLLLLVVFIGPAVSVLAENVIFPPGPLQIVDGVGGSLAPTGSNTGKSNSLSGNTVTVLSTGTVSGNVYGAINRSDTDAVSDNKVVIEGNVSGSSYPAGSVYGGYTRNAEVTGNSVTLGNGGTVNRDVYGGYSTYGNAVNNSVTIGNGGTVNGYVCGGFGMVGKAANNRVIITGGTANGRVDGGGNSGGGDVTDNIVTISDSVVSSVFGGTSNVSNVTGNIVIISNSTVGSVSGGVTGERGNVTSNKVTINGGEVENNVTGGAGYGNGIISDNSVTINGGSVEGNITGGWSESDTATNNTVEISGGDVKQHVYGGYIDSGNGNAIGNSVKITGGTVGGASDHVYGGRATSGAATNNSVTVANGTVNGIVYGGWSSAGNVSDNKVAISGGEVKQHVYGGHCDSGSAAGNSVNVSNGTISGTLSGGSTLSGSATGNTVTISGTPDLHNANIYGGFKDSGTGDVFTGNTLHLYGMTLPMTKLMHMHTAAGLANFQNLNFYLPDSTKDGDILLTVTDTADITDTQVKVVFDIANASLKAHNKVVLIDANDAGAHLVGEPEDSTLSLTRGVPSLVTRAKKGATLEYDIEIATERASGISGDPGQLVLYLIGDEPEVIPETGSLPDGFLTGITQLNQGGNLVAGQSLMNKMMCATRHPRYPTRHPNLFDFSDFGVFCDLSGNWSRYHSGSQIDLAGTNLIVGLSRCFSTRYGQLAGGMFYEYGKGSYNAFSAFDNGVAIDSNGGLDHNGGGVLGRFDFGRFRTRSGFAQDYLDGSFRAGNIRNNYFSNLCDGFGTAAHYTASAAYYGAHLGGGRTWDFADDSSLDLYGKYLWTQMQGDSVVLTTGDPIDFESVNSHRLRFGGRYVFSVNSFLYFANSRKNTFDNPTVGRKDTFGSSKDTFGSSLVSRIYPYLGAAWEHELDGTSRARVASDASDATNGYAIHAPSLRGGTGIGEFGIAFKPATSRDFFADLGVQGTTGRRDGVTAALTVGRRF